MPKTPATVIEYISAAPASARPMLRQLRRIVRQTVPQAKERISYGMPYYSLDGRLAYFAAFRDHVSYFVMGTAIRRQFATALRPYLHGRATLQFPIGTAIPTRLIQQLLRVVVRSNRQPV